MKGFVTCFDIAGHYTTSRKVAGLIPDGATVFFRSTYSFQPHYGFEVDLDSSRNEYRKIFLGIKRGRRIGLDNLTAICEPIL
jgi:hypothetical protein